MKNFILITLFCLGAFLAQAQTTEPQYTVNKQGELVVKPTATKTKTPDKVYKVIGNRTFYIGPKGGIYEWKVKADGTRYKKYLPKEK